jgi:hypothetical protein
MAVRHYDRKGKEITIEEFRRLYRPEYYQLTRTRLGDTLVSTMWLGVNHASTESGPIEIFETFIASPDPRYDGYVGHYATEKAARTGHRFLVARIRRGLPLL